MLAGTIHYRAGRLDRAQATLSAVLQAGDTSPATRARAHFIAGLIAADLAALPALRDHIAALREGTAVASRADYLELQASLPLEEGTLQLRLGDTMRLRGLIRENKPFTGSVQFGGGEPAAMPNPLPPFPPSPPVGSAPLLPGRPACPP